MTRLLAAAATAALFLPPAHAVGADPAGLWKLRFADGQDSVTLLLSLSKADGKWVGDFIGSSAKLKLEPTFSAVGVDGDHVRFALAFGGREFINFDGVIAADGKKLSGSYTQFGGRLRLGDLHPSKLKKLDDPFDLARENAAQLDGPELFDAGFAVAERAAEKKLPAEEVRGIADRLGKAATAYGPRWERTIAARLADTLAGQKGYADVALAQARKAERLLGDDAPAAQAIAITETLARALDAADKPDEAKQARATAAKLEARDFAEYAKAALGFTPDEYKGRKAKSDRTVLVEIFTGAECPPCAAVDLATDGLLKTYKPTEVMTLQYHFHVPQPDPLTSPEGMERATYYADKLTGAPTLFLNGKIGPEGGGPASAAKAKYAEYRDLIDPILEKPAGAKLAVTVTKTDKGYSAKATVSDLEAPGEKVKLRFALAEDRVRFAGGNGIRYHHHVVRAMPGGAKGTPLTKRTAEHVVTFDPAAVRAELAAYLTEYAQAEAPFPHPERPLALRNLKLVAFIQDDATGEVLQTAVADVAP